MLTDGGDPVRTAAREVEEEAGGLKLALERYVNHDWSLYGYISVLLLSYSILIGASESLDLLLSYSTTAPTCTQPS